MNHKTINGPQMTVTDIDQIRKLLPYGWRQQIQTLHPGLTARQISETFYLRTRNAAQASKVFGVIQDMLVKLQQFDLARKCQQRIEACKAAQLVAAV